MNTFNVFLDTNIFINAKYDFNRASLQNLKKYRDNDIVNMFTNDIIIREVEHHIKSDVDLLAKQAKNAIKKHGELLNALTQPVFENIESTLLNAPNQLVATFQSYMDCATIIPNDNVSVVNLFDDYFSPNAPFEGRQEKKSEFPDAVIIMSIKQYLASNMDIILHVVTDDKGWHNALKETNGVILHKDIKSLLTIISKEQELYHKIISYVSDETEVLKKQLEDWLVEQDWESVVDEADMCVECDVVDSVSVKEIDLILDGIEYINSDEGYAIVTLSSIAQIEIEFSYIDHTEEIYDKEDHEWYNTLYGNGKAEIAIPISMSVTVLLADGDNDDFDIEPPDFDEIDKNSCEIIDYELTEHVYDTLYNICPDCGERMGLHNDGGNGFCVNCAPNH